MPEVSSEEKFRSLKGVNSARKLLGWEDSGIEAGDWCPKVSEDGNGYEKRARMETLALSRAKDAGR
ncbi:MAG TPA: hypothetical protein VFT51_08180 [Bacillales bacterium]|nr:hypothetical protein [Bacillales bacterium]